MVGVSGSVKTTLRTKVLLLGYWIHKRKQVVRLRLMTADKQLGGEYDEATRLSGAEG